MKAVISFDYQQYAIELSDMMPLLHILERATSVERAYNEDTHQYDYTLIEKNLPDVTLVEVVVGGPSE